MAAGRHATTTARGRHRRRPRRDPIAGRGALATVAVVLLVAVSAATALPEHDTANTRSPRHRLVDPNPPSTPAPAGVDGGAVPSVPLPPMAVGPAGPPVPVSVVGPVDPGGTEVAVSYVGGIPAVVLAAYRDATSAVARSQPGCRLPVELLAAIGKVESGHARGGQVSTNGTAEPPILGPVLDGSDGFAAIADTDGGALDGDTVWDRAVGPMQFIPSTWRRWASDGNNDGIADPENVYDASLSAARYLCAGGRDLATDAGIRSAILSYNDSPAYLRLVSAWLAAYRGGIAEVADDVTPAGRGNGTPTTTGTPVSPGSAPTATVPPTAVLPTTPPVLAPTGVQRTPLTTPGPPPAGPVPTTSAPPTTPPPVPVTEQNPVQSLLCGLGALLGSLLGAPSDCDASDETPPATP